MYNMLFILRYLCQIQKVNYRKLLSALFFNKCYKGLRIEFNSYKNTGDELVMLTVMHY